MDVLQLQRKIRDLKIFSVESNLVLPQVLLLTEHDPVYTAGRRESSRISDVQVVHVERGGQTTFHCPGQLVCYPILNLGDLRKDLRWYVHSLEQIVIDSIAEFNVSGARHPAHPGVWVGKNKIAAIGASFRKWITMHGTAVNVDCDTSGFSKIIPCGIEDPELGVVKLEEFIPDIQVQTVEKAFLKHFQKHFQLNLELQDLQDFSLFLSENQKKQLDFLASDSHELL
jgi:lipoyl(octanoyl) transferase